MGDVLFLGGGDMVPAFLGKSGAVVLQQDSARFVDEGSASTVRVDVGGECVEFMPWGVDNDLPGEVVRKMHGNITVGSNADFNAKMCYGDGVMVVRKERDGSGRVCYRELLDSDAPEVFGFLGDNNVVRLLQECGSDLVTFGDAFVELVLSRDGKRVVMLRHREAVLSRLSRQVVGGDIEWHGYSGGWAQGDVGDCVVTRFLSRDKPLWDLKVRMGLVADGDSGVRCMGVDRRFVVSLGVPTPGRFYYNRPFWWSIFKSGWYDFSCLIPFFKMALMRNEMVLKYEVSINVDFWGKLFKAEGITDVVAQGERKLAFLRQLDGFLAGHKNAGKSFIKHFQYDRVKGVELHDIVIKPIESFIKGGEYIEDSEEANNTLCYAMGVHPSLQGASPGKGKNINGTEARELFIIKQALSKPLREALLLPLYMAKAVNGWDADIHFVIPNIMLTTLDAGTGAVKSIGNERV